MFLQFVMSQGSKCHVAFSCCSCNKPRVSNLSAVTGTKQTHGDWMALVTNLLMSSEILATQLEIKLASLTAREKLLQVISYCKYVFFLSYFELLKHVLFSLFHKTCFALFLPWSQRDQQW